VYDLVVEAKQIEKLTSIVIQPLFPFSWLFVSHLMVAGSLKFHDDFKLTVNQIRIHKIQYITNINMRSCYHSQSKVLRSLSHNNRHICKKYLS